MKITILIFTLSLFLFSCDSGKNGSFATKVFNPSVASSLVNLDKELKVVRTELKFESGNKVNSCTEYAKEIKTSKIIEGVNNQLAKSEYLICDSLILLANKSHSVVSADNVMSTILANKLDLRSFPSSLGPRLDEKSYTIKNVAGNNLVIKENNIIYETEDWHYRIELIAISDVNNNKKDDWILWFIDESKSGNYRSYQTLVLYDVDTSKKLITAQSYLVN